MITIRPECRLRAVRSLFSSCTSTNNRYVSSSSSSSTISHDQQQQQQKQQRTERVRRSMLSVPGVDERKIKKSQQVGTDCVVLDLEDGVAHHRKDEARELVRDTLMAMDPSASSSSLFGGSEVCVRINGLDTKDVAYNDLKAIMPCERLRAIVVPKVECASDIHFVTRMIDTLRVGNTNDIRIIACIESAMGFLNLHEIAKTSITSSTTTTTTINTSSHPHYRYHPLDALVFASEDYCSDVEAVRTKSATELLYARSQLVMTAKAYALQAIDMVHINFRDQDGLIEECDDGRRLGFTGKQAIHPDQVDIIQDRFSPSIKDVLFATKVVEAYRRTTSQGIGACVVDGIVVDLPVYKHAVKVCRRGKNMELLKNESKSK